MALYEIVNGKLKIVNNKDFKLEKDLQKLCDDNLETLFRLKPIKCQFTIENFRIDTLAFDEEIKAFVVVEYKKDENFSVIDQGYTYLSLVLNNKAECVLAYQETTGRPLSKNEIDWPQTKVLFIAPSFSTYQINSINFKDLPIELWRVKRYANNIVSVEQIEPARTNESIKVITKTKNKTKKEIQLTTYNEQDHLAKASESTRELYEQVKERILQLGDIKIKPTKFYVAFIATTNFVDINIQQKSLKIYINMRKGELNDPMGKARDVSTIGHWGNGDYEIVIKDDTNLDYVIYLIKQSYEKNK